MLLKRYFLILFLIFFLLPSYSNAQWQQVLDEDTRYIFATDSTVYAGIDPFGLYRSSNNGQSWSMIYQASGISDIIIDNNIMYMCWGNKLVKSTNGGYNWTDLLITDHTYDVELYNSILIAGVYDSGVYVSTNYGINWSQSNLQNITVRSLSRIGSKIYAATGESGIFVSTDAGMNWSQTSFIIPDLLKLGVHGSTIFVSVRYRGLFASTDEGISWYQTELDSGNVNSIISYGNSVIVASSSLLPEQHGILRSENNFQSWVPLNEGLAPLQSAYSIDFNSNYFFAGLSGWITGSKGGVFRRDRNQISGITVVNTSIPDKYSLHQNYPNPFNPSTKISFAVSKTSNVRMLIYDHLGREVATLINEELSPGTYEKEFDGSNLSSGIYYYKLITGEFSETKKMVLVK